LKSHYNPLESMVVFSLGGTTLWSGNGRLRHEDLGLSEDEAPPEAIASLGTKKLFPPAKLKALQKLKRLMHRDCAEVGMRFLGGYAVPEAKAEALAAKLDDRVREGQALADEFLRNFDATVKAWHRDNPEWAHILRAGTPQKEAVGARIRFDYEAYLVSKPKSSVVGARFGGAVSALGDSLYREVASEAADFVQKSLLPGREDGTQRTAGPVRRMLEKLRGLSFLDARITPLIDVLTLVMSRVPANGPVKDDSFLAIVCVASALADPATMQSVGERAAAGESPEDLADELMGGSKPQAAAASPKRRSDRAAAPTGAAAPAYLDRITTARREPTTLQATEIFGLEEEAPEHKPVATIVPPQAVSRAPAQPPRPVATPRRAFQPLEF